MGEIFLCLHHPQTPRKGSNSYQVKFIEHSFSPLLCVYVCVCPSGERKWDKNE